MNFRLSVLFALLAGALGALGLAPYGIWPATLVSLAGAFILFDRADSPRQAALTGWAFGTGYFALALLWIVEPFLVEPEIYGWMAPFALVFMAAGLALFWAVGFLVAARAREGMRLLTLITALAVAELARAYVLTGFPWAGFAQIWVGHGPDLLLATIGPHGLGLITLFAGLALARAIAGQGALPVRLLGLLPVAAVLGFGFVLAASLPPVAEGAKVVRLVQPNARQDQKWDPEMIPVFLNRNLTFTAQTPRPDLIVWPETSVPTLMEYGGPIFEEMSAAAQGTPVIAGVQRREGARLYNSAFLLDGATPTQIYDKHHLVPFGEYIPLGDLAARFGLFGFAARDGQGFSSGSGPRLMDLGDLGRALPLICYEAVFPQLSRTADRPDMLIQITNDGWFGQHSGPYQHLAQARMRAIEQGLPMIRVANTGISAMIDPYGRITHSLGLGEAGYLDAPLPQALPKTLYARSGDWPMLGLLILASLGLVAMQRRNI
ncbi:apolipoprotein N-acyltransferase [Aestuariivita boseongensis]|uniref:apolipoprotein N-acyltransferase n=1 Tax=Aestuariivita boseongensis TaxID=1470562 RepID=UPI000680D63A|nr:apolipoprotein N-acyltransferase [Aestuariivita boseongensis]